MTTHAFQTEVTQLLQLMIHSLYSEREIFLRELISNASDACDKLRFQALTRPELTAGDAELGVVVKADKEAGTLTLTDNGIGLTEAEAVDHLGTIAKSGTKAFLAGIGDDQRKNAQLIGQFGVGFYAAFMVADKVVVESRSAHAGADDAVRWESAGDGQFATERITRAQRGTTVTLHLKPDAKEFLDGWRLRSLIKRWSDYVTYPVRMPKEDGKELEQVNAGQPLWTRPKDQITDQQYTDFYRAACKLWDEPATRIHATVEGTLSFTALLFIPSQRPMDLFERERRGVSLYVRRVFVMDDCTDLLPEWLRCVRGIVDSDDLPLNVSREMLQERAVVGKLRKQLVKRVLDHLLKLAQSGDEADRAAWGKIDAAFGPILREGIVTDHDNKDRAARLARWASTWTTGKPAEGEAARPERTGLEDYVRRCPESQRTIYVLQAPSLAAAQANPALEGFRSRNIEVLFLCDPVDEWVAQHLTEFDGRKLVDAAKGAADLASEAEKKELEAKAGELKPLMDFCQESLGEGIGEVRLTARLADSPCCLVGDEHAMSAQMEEMMRRMGQEPPPRKRVLELNPTHPLIAGLERWRADPARREDAADLVRLLRDQADLAAGHRVEDGAGAAARLQRVLGKLLA